MNLTRYKKVNVHVVAQELQRHMEFTNHQKAQLVEALSNTPYTFIAFEKTEKPNPFFRLTVIPFYIFFFCLAISVPFRWVFLGFGGYTYDSKIFNFYLKWEKALGF